MTPRARKATDPQIYAAVALVTARVGPDRMTLDDVAREVGLTPSALVQRFGSKRELMLAAVREWNEQGEDPIAAVRGADASALETLHAYAACVADSVSDPTAFANQLAMLQLDVADPEFRTEAARFFRGERETLRAWVAEAVDDGDLAGTADPERLARAIQAALSGWRIVWAILREGSPGDEAAEILDTLIAPHRPWQAGPGRRPVRGSPPGSR